MLYKFIKVGYTKYMSLYARFFGTHTASSLWKTVSRSKLQPGQVVEVNHKVFQLDQTTKPIIGSRGEVLTGREIGGSSKIEIPTRMEGGFLDCPFKVRK